jgi:hypothetical protein
MENEDSGAILGFLKYVPPSGRMLCLSDGLACPLVNSYREESFTNYWKGLSGSFLRRIAV